jgi:hypothetical protein
MTEEEFDEDFARVTGRADDADFHDRTGFENAEENRESFFRQSVSHGKRVASQLGKKKQPARFRTGCWQVVVRSTGGRERKIRR